MKYEDQLRELLRLFLEKNTELNLSALRDEEKCWTGNIEDSLAGSEVISNLKPVRLADGLATSNCLDIGTGGGFPLLPLAITHPDMQCTGMDSTTKKCKAVQEIAKSLGLCNVHLAIGRTEELGKDPAHRETYSIVTARALSPLPTLLEYAAPFLVVGGKLLAWKSMQVEEELAQSEHAQKQLSLKLVDTYVYDLGGDFGKRQILVFTKTAKTSDRFPREVGAAKKKPL